MPISTPLRMLAERLLSPKRNKLPDHEADRRNWVKALMTGPTEPLPMEGRYNLLPLRQTDYPMMGDTEWATPGIAAAGWNALTAPGRALYGEQPFNVNQEAQNFGLTFTGGGLGAAGAPKGSLSIQPSGLAGRLGDIESGFAKKIGNDPALAMQHYENLPGTEGGRVLNTDLAREMSGTYRGDRSLSSAVHEPASALVREEYQKLLRQAPDANHDPVVLFTGGGTGAGKSTAIAGVLGPRASRAQIVYDTNLSSFESSATKIDQALQAGKSVSIAYVWREPIEALTGGALARATRQEAKQGSGRTVPIEEHVKTHVGAANTIRELAKRYEGNPNVEIVVIDNSRGPGKAVQMNINELPVLDYSSLYNKAGRVLETARQDAQISEQVYRGFKGQ